MDITVVSVLELASTLPAPSTNPDLLRVLVSAVLNQVILVLVTDLLLMVMLLAVSAGELVSMPQDLSMSPDLPRVLVSAVLMLSQVIIHRTTGHQLLLPTVPPPVTDVVASVVLSQDILVSGTDMVSEASALVLDSTQLGQSMSPDQPRVSAVDTCTRLLFFVCNMLEINLC